VLASVGIFVAATRAVTQIAKDGPFALPGIVRHVNDQWTDVDVALESWLLQPDETLTSALADAAAAGMPTINVTALQGRLLQLLAVSLRATRILEIGTLAGYSAIWLARGLAEGGRLTTLEREPSYAEVAQANLTRAGVADRVDVVVGPAADTLRSLDSETFDLTFIDADKASTPLYFDWAVAHTRAGGMVVVDNVVRGGAVLDDSGQDPNVEGIRQFLSVAGRDERVAVTALQTVGGKGYDGFARAVVR
jgi:predicted O-methyltransferase YrrM